MPKMFTARNVATVPTRMLWPSLTETKKEKQNRITAELCSDSEPLSSSFIPRVSFCDTQGHYVSPDAARSSQTRGTGSVITVSLVHHCNPEGTVIVVMLNVAHVLQI